MSRRTMRMRIMLRSRSRQVGWMSGGYHPDDVARRCRRRDSSATVLSNLPARLSPNHVMRDCAASGLTQLVHSDSPIIPLLNGCVDCGYLGADIFIHNAQGLTITTVTS